MKILIVKTHAMGDLLLVTPSIRALRSIYKDAEITVMTGKWSAPILYNNPYINNLITIDDSILFKRRYFSILSLIIELAKKQFDIAFIFQPSISIHALIFASFIKRRIGLSFKNRGFMLTDPVTWDPGSSRYIAENYLDTVKKIKNDSYEIKLDLFLTQNEIEEAEHFLEKNGVSGCRKVIGISPGGGKNPRDYVPMKIWDTGKYINLINRLQAEFDIDILLFGADNDKNICGEIGSKTLKKVIDTCGKTNIRQLIALIRKCDLLLTNDSAPVHFAVAVGTPSITIFGPTNPYTLLPENPEHHGITSPIDCSPCYSHEAFPGCDTPCCMDYIDVETVLDTIRNKLHL